MEGPVVTRMPRGLMVVILALTTTLVVVAPSTAQARPTPNAGQVEVGNTAWLELAQQAAAESATAMPFVEDSGQNIPVWWIAPVAWYSGKTFGWQATATNFWMGRVYARQLPSGGFGLGYAWDWRNDGSVNPAGTAYTITTAGHVGRMLIEGYDDGGVPRDRVLRAVTSLLNTSTTAGGRCISYSDSPNDANKPCVFNVNATAAWFLWSAYRRGIVPSGRDAEMNGKWRTFRDYNWTHGFSDDLTGWNGAPGFPYEQGQTTLQDPWHHAATVWPLYEMDPATGIKGMNGHFANYSSSANADLVVYDCSRISSSLLGQARTHAFPAYNSQAERLQSRSRWTIMALRVHRACYSVAGEPTNMGDFDNDGRADFAFRRPSAHTWSIQYSGGGTLTDHPWGGSSHDVPLVGHVDGDGRDDLVIWARAAATWSVWYTSGAPPRQNVQFGQAGDVPLLADVDGDGRDDFVVRRTSDATWSVSYANGSPPLLGLAMGAASDLPLAGDLDGDGRDDLTLWSRNGLWSARLSAGGSLSQQWGLAGDIPLLGDVNGDGRDDFVVRRPSTRSWLVQHTSGGSTEYGWGGSVGDVPLLGDVDGDGRDDLVIWARGGGWWVYYTSGAPPLNRYQFGQAGDIPV
ncbi:hypothetical protein GCM10009558_087330 [Virgisporangium aurantiacum]